MWADLPTSGQELGFNLLFDARFVRKRTCQRTIAIRRLEVELLETGSDDDIRIGHHIASVNAIVIFLLTA
jgi:hypothetical protein